MVVRALLGGREVGQERRGPAGEVGRDGVAGLVVDGVPVGHDVFDGGIAGPVDPALGGGQEDAGEAAGAGGVDLAADRAVLVGEVGDQGGHQLGGHLGGHGVGIGVIGAGVGVATG